METYKVAIIANLRARGGRAIKALHPIIRYTERKNQKKRFLIETPNDLSCMAESIIRVINEFEADLIVIFGGDGTLHRVVDKINYLYKTGEIKRKPPLAPIGGGTQESLLKWLGWSNPKDDILKILGLSKLPYKIFTKIVNTPLDHLPLRKIKPLKITYNNAKENNELQDLYGFIFIMGAVNRIIELYDQDDKSLAVGLKHITLGALASITGYPKSHAHLVHQFKTKITGNGKEIQHDNPLTIIASVTKSLLFGIKPLQGHAESNQFYVGSYAIPAWMISLILPFFARAFYVPPTNQFYNKPVSQLSILAPNEGSFFTDGDIHYNQPGTIIILSVDEENEFVSFIEE